LIKHFPSQLLIWLALLFVIAGFYIFNLFRRIDNLMKNPTLLPDDGPIFLFLRSFEADKFYPEVDFGLLNSHWTTREEELSKVFAKYGSLVAVGAPDELIPKLGGFRVYFSNNDWKDGVAKLADRSDIILFKAFAPSIVYEKLPNILSETALRQSIPSSEAKIREDMWRHYMECDGEPYFDFRGARWEVEYLVSHQDGSKVLLLIPEELQMYDAFFRATQGIFPNNLIKPKIIKQLIDFPNHQFMCLNFDDHWNCLGVFELESEVASRMKM
jgi:hypothetical protein